MASILTQIATDASVVFIEEVSPPASSASSKGARGGGRSNRRNISSTVTARPVYAPGNPGTPEVGGITRWNPNACWRGFLRGLNLIVVTWSRLRRRLTIRPVTRPGRRYHIFEIRA